MKQEQPFEIKTFNEVVQNFDTYAGKFIALGIYHRDTNAEIRRLQKQLADAPSWGEWQYATIENLENAPVGIYELESFTGETMVRFKCDFRDGLPWKGSSTETADCVMIEECTRFRRLNYEPKPARESDDESNNKSTDQEQEGWTPISNEPLYDLPNGMYIFKGKNGLPIFAIKDTIDGISSISLQASTRTPSMSWKPLLGDIVELFVSYKLIHAFEEPKKKYHDSNGNWHTLEELANNEHMHGARELARDLLAARERIKELEEK